jgi:hypothetical protein
MHSGHITFSLSVALYFKDERAARTSTRQN